MTSQLSQYHKNVHSLAPYLCGYYSVWLIISCIYYNSQDFPYFVVGCNCNSRLSTTSVLCPGVLFEILHLPRYDPCIFTQSFSFFLETCPYQLKLFRCTTVIISSVPSLSAHSSEPVTLSPGIHLIILISAHCGEPCSLSSLAKFHCDVTYNFEHNLCITPLL